MDRCPRSAVCAALGGDGTVLVEFASYWGDAAGPLRVFVADFESVWADLAYSFPLDESSESAVWMACSNPARQLDAGVLICPFCPVNNDSRGYRPADLHRMRSGLPSLPPGSPRQSRPDLRGLRRDRASASLVALAVLRVLSGLAPAGVAPWRLRVA